MSDPYNSPEKFNLEIVFVADNGGSYEFDMFVVWKDTNGALYYATDSGCSCPSPFEWLEDLADLSPASKADIITAMDGWWSATTEDRISLRNALDRV